MPDLSIEAWVTIAVAVGAQVVTFITFLAKIKHRQDIHEERLDKHDENFNGFGKLLRTKRWSAEEEERCAIAEAKAREIEDRKKRLAGTD